jgi:hypothetical protein
MKLKIKEIVLVEERPFCFADFKEFEICGEKYKMDHGTFRNNILRLKKAGDVETLPTDTSGGGSDNSCSSSDNSIGSSKNDNSASSGNFSGGKIELIKR